MSTRMSNSASTKLTSSLDELIKSDRGDRGDRGGGGGAMRSRGRDRESDKPYSRPSRMEVEQSTGGDGASVFVGNLAWSVEWKALKAHMRSAGEVERADVMMAEDGRSRGFGIVEFSSAKGARKAIATLHDSELEGRAIVVREDRGERTDVQDEAALAAAVVAGGTGAQVSQSLTQCIPTPASQGATGGEARPYKLCRRRAAARAQGQHAALMVATLLNSTQLREHLLLMREASNGPRMDTQPGGSETVAPWTDGSLPFNVGRGKSTTGFWLAALAGLCLATSIKLIACSSLNVGRSVADGLARFTDGLARFSKPTDMRPHRAMVAETTHGSHTGGRHVDHVGRMVNPDAPTIPRSYVSCFLGLHTTHAKEALPETGNGDL
eukprot:CAMPEP_0119379292 /NCGR_PEP_ID=MMETSP1334-20130426/52028_1 /TAXON_ID=127549 /ORGANISM="Calcidiscus leptoporus, Strain RCC1130" /LENGTH=380 /DNA_ID=CAMNT_0007398757 /DNA_START=39 /DNA_END=1185 /DNA_ORIENTATION=-